MTALVAIAAMTPERVLGDGEKITWHIPGEQKWFRQVTWGHPILMGRKTYLSIGRPLPGRRNLVVSRSHQWDGVEMIPDLGAFDPDRYEQTVYVIGGAQIYRAMLPRCQELLITHVFHHYAGSVYFPAYEQSFREAETIAVHAEYRIARYVRRDAPG